jgi:hypothetical protein
MLKKILGLILIVAIIRGYVIFHAAFPSGHGRLGDTDVSGRVEFLLLFVFTSIFWFWMFVDVLIRKMHVWLKVAGIFMILFGSLPGSILYFFCFVLFSGTQKQQAPPDAPADQPPAMPACVG